MSAAATTSGVGPGYHTFVGRVLERLGDEGAITWAPPGDRPAGSPAPWVGSRQPLAERADVEREHLVQLRRALERAREQGSLRAAGRVRWACFREPASSTMAPC